jgi:hypothetical protein
MQSSGQGLRGGEARDQRFTGIFTRSDVGHDAVLATHGTDQERRHLSNGRPVGHLVALVNEFAVAERADASRRVRSASVALARTD